VTPVEATQDQAGAEATTETAAGGDSAPVDAVAAASPDAVAAAELIEVWRPGGRSDERRPRHDRSRHRHHERPKEGAAPAAAAAGEAGEAAKHERHRRGRRARNQEFRKPGTDAPLEAAAPAADGAPVREPREDNKDRASRERFRGRDKEKGRDADQHKGKFAGGRDNGGRDKGGRDKGGRDKGGRDKGGRDKRPDSGPSHRQYATSASPRERERPIDPNSPFAKLAALKEQLTANRKDR
jgi:ATP-dependent RNA helicase SUPV3L1/SUV3